MYYPKLKERPSNFRINRGVGHPLAKGCTLAMLGWFPGTATAYDSGAYGNNGILNGLNPTETWTHLPDLGRWGWEFGGISYQYVDFGDKPHWYSNTYTYCAWLRGKYAAGKTTVTQPFNNGIWRMVFDWDHKDLGFDRTFEHHVNNGSVKAIRFTSDLLGNTWYHVCITYDGAYARAWLNGVNETTVTAGSLATSSGPLTFPRPQHPWPGKMADVFGFNRALSASEISALADPENVDLRVGGIPLILPPKRVWWPVVTAPVTAKKTPWHLMIQGAI